MQPTDRAKFLDALQGVYAMYRVELSEAVIAIWLQAMHGYELPAIVDAFGRHCMNPDTGQFLPKPADVVKMLHGTTLDSGQQAWVKALRGMQAVGSYETVCFDDPSINAVLYDMGGWVEFGRMTERDLPFRQKEFVERYRGYRMRGRLLAYPRELPGIFATQNTARGFGGPETVLIGDRKAAALVYRAGGDGVALAVTPLSEALQLLPGAVTA